MKKLYLLLAICLLLTACAGTSQPEAPAVTEAPAITEAPEETAPVIEEAVPEVAAEPTATPEPVYEGMSFALTTVTGEGVDESYIQGNKLTMVNFWATWCGPCVGELPDLARLHEDYADKGFGILGVMLDEDTGAALSLINESAIGYPIVLNDVAFNELTAGVSAVPTTLFFDAAGKQVGETQIGSMSYEGWAALIDGLLQEIA